MPAPVYRGSFPVLVSETTKQTDRGAIEYTTSRVYLLSNVTTGTIGATLSRAGKTLSLTSISVDTKDGLATVTQTYTGGDSSVPDVYEAICCVQEEPIASHPAFTVSTGIYGTSIVVAAGGVITEGTTGSGGALFGADGNFIAFTNKATNDLMGVQSFLSPRATYRKIYSAGQAPSTTLTEQVSWIFSNPAGDPPTIQSGRNWILNAVSWKNNGNQKTSSGQFEITEEYLASGPSGWNNAIYYTAN